MLLRLPEVEPAVLPEIAVELLLVLLKAVLLFVVLFCAIEVLLELESVVAGVELVLIAPVALLELGLAAATLVELLLASIETFAPAVGETAYPGTFVVVVVTPAGVSVEVEEDLVVWLQPLRIRPRIAAIKTVFFIGDLSCAPTDRASSPRFKNGAANTVIP